MLKVRAAVSTEAEAFKIIPLKVKFMPLLLRYKQFAIIFSGARIIAASPPNIKKVKNINASENSIERSEYGKVSIILGAKKTVIARRIKNSKLNIVWSALKIAYRKHNPPRLIIKSLNKFRLGLWFIDTGETVGISVV